MKTSNAVIIIFCKVVLPSTAHLLGSYLNLSLTVESLVSLCVFLLQDRVWGIGDAHSL